MNLYLTENDNLTPTKDFAKKFTLSEIDKLNVADYELKES